MPSAWDSRCLPSLLTNWETERLPSTASRLVAYKVTDKKLMALRLMAYKVTDKKLKIFLACEQVDVGWRHA